MFPDLQDSTLLVLLAPRLETKDLGRAAISLRGAAGALVVQPGLASDAGPTRYILVLKTIPLKHSPLEEENLVCNAVLILVGQAAHARAIWRAGTASSPWLLGGQMGGRLRGPSAAAELPKWRARMATGIMDTADS